MVIHILGLDPLTAGSNALPFDDYMLRYIYYKRNETFHLIIIFLFSSSIFIF